MSNTHNRRRQAKGTPVGGQYATEARTEPTISLNATVSSSDSEVTAWLLEQYLGGVGTQFEPDKIYRWVYENDYGTDGSVVENFEDTISGRNHLVDGIVSEWVDELEEHPTQVDTSGLEWVAGDNNFLVATATVDGQKQVFVKPKQSLLSTGGKLVRTEETLLEAAHAALSDPDTPTEIIVALATHKDRDVRGRVATHSDAPPGVLTSLAVDEDAHVRRGVAGNWNTPTGVLTSLAGDAGQYIGEIVARNPNTSPEVLTQLAGDEDWCVRSNVASNPNTPVDVLVTLAGDKELSVRGSVAHNRNLPVEVLTRLAGDKEYHVREFVAMNSNTPGETLTLLATDEARNVRARVATNLNSPPELLRLLAGDEDSGVRAWVAGNPNSPPEVVQQLTSLN